jgi:O-antigen/teichoic acid export membrane protein
MTVSSKFALLKEDTASTKSNLELSSLVLSGSIWNLGSQAVILLSSLLATPFTIRLLGIEAYGVFSLLNLLISYLSVADLGMGQAAIRFATEAQAKEEAQAEAAVIWTSLVILMIPLGLVTVGLIAAAPSLISRGLKLPVHLHQETIQALRFAAFGLLAKGMAGVLIAAQYVRMRANLYSLVNTLSSVGQIILIPIILFWQGGVFVAVVIVTCINLATSIVNAILLKRLLPEWGKPKIKLQLIRPLLRFGGATSLVTLTGIILFHLEKLMLAQHESVVMLAYYSVAFTLARLLMIFPVVIVPPLLSAFSRLQAVGAETAVHNLYNQSVRGLWLGLIPTSLVICSCARPVLGLWAGEAFSQHSLYPLYILALGAIFDGISYVPRILLSASGRPDLIARFQIVNLIPYFFLTWVLIEWVGIIGAAMAWTARSAVECAMAFYTVRHNLGFSANACLTRKRTYFITLVACLGVAVYVSYINASAPIVVSLTVAAFLIHIVMIWRLILTKNEKCWITERISAL